jgi:hypothetical protein
MNRRASKSMLTLLSALPALPPSRALPPLPPAKPIFGLRKPEEGISDSVETVAIPIVPEPLGEKTGDPSSIPFCKPQEPRWTVSVGQ